MVVAFGGAGAAERKALSQGWERAPLAPAGPGGGNRERGTRKENGKDGGVIK